MQKSKAYNMNRIPKGLKSNKTTKNTQQNKFTTDLHSTKLQIQKNIDLPYVTPKNYRRATNQNTKNSIYKN